MTKKQVNSLDTSIESFKLLKKVTEKHWKKVEYMECCGWQIQEGTTWRNGLTELELIDFQEQLGLVFPQSLKNYFMVMNGLDKLEIDFNGDLTQKPEFGRSWYAYPESIEEIKSTITWILEGNSVPENVYGIPQFTKIFPYHAHRCLVIDANELVLSMWGNDIVYWSQNLAKGIAGDMRIAFSSFHAMQLPQGFWYDKVR